MIDRADALRLVHAALAQGRIIQADHDLRVAQLESAGSQTDIDAVVRDLTSVTPAAAPVRPPAPVPAVAVAPAPERLYGPAVTEAAPTPPPAAPHGRVRGAALSMAAAAVVALVIAGGTIAISASRDSYDFSTTETATPTDDATYSPGQAPTSSEGVNLHTVEGFTELVDALRSETGATYVYDAVLYPRYAVLDVPTGTGRRYQSWYWDGRTLERQSTKSTSSDDQLDLGLVDPAPMVAVLTQVRGRVEEPTSWYVIYHSPAGAQPQLAAYASNDFSETSYILQGFDGTVLYDSEQS